MYKIAIIGAGNMGGAIARGLASCHLDVTISNPSQEKLNILKKENKSISVTASNREAVKDAALIILAVKPWIVERVIKEIAPCIDFRSTVIASLAAGIDLSTLSSFTSPWTDSPMLVRVMPNTAISVGQSMTIMCHNGISDGHIAMLTETFDRLGHTAVMEERLFNAATALCSCGIAYAMRYVRAAVEGAVELGLYPDKAREYVLQTLLGAVTLLRTTGNHPESEIDKVTTPGGITIRGLNAMEAAGFTNSVIQGLKQSV